MSKLHISLILRILVGILASAATALFVTQLLYGVARNIGGIVGLMLSLVALTYVVFAPKINTCITNAWRARGHGRRVLIALACVASLILITSIIETAFMLAYAHRKAPDSDQPPVLIVLGCQVKDSGPSMLLQQRINTAYDYLVAHPEAKCIVSGGKGYDEPISEAQCMYDRLVAMGIDPTRIYMEDQSTTTRENLEFSKEIMEHEGLGDTAILVTNSWHELRAQLAAADVGIACGGEGAPTPWWLLPAFYIRELFGILYQIVF